METFRQKKGVLVTVLLLCRGTVAKAALRMRSVGAGLWFLEVSAVVITVGRSMAAGMAGVMLEK